MELVIMKKQIGKLIVGVAVGILPSVMFAEVDYGSLVKGDEPELYVDKYGKGDPVVVSNGYIFLDYKYMSGPYVVQRVGQAVTVNGVVVNCLYKQEIPQKQERYVREYVGSDGNTHTWSSPPHPSSNLKETADIWADMLAEWLREHVVVLSKMQYQIRQIRPISDEGMQKRLPVIEKMAYGKFPKALMSALSETTEEGKLNAIKTEDKSWRLNDEDTMLIIKNARDCPALMERIRAETATETQLNVQTNRVPAAATQHN